MKDLYLKVNKFKTGNIKNYYNIGAKITSDNFIFGYSEEGSKSERPTFV